MATTPPPPAPFGYTKAGKPRKRVQSKEGICSIKNCKKRFRHRKDPKQAVWQHLFYFFRPEIASPNELLAVAHRALHAEKKKEINQHLTEEEKKEHRKQASRRFAEKNPEKRKQAAAFANLKVKAQRHLIMDGKEVNKEIVDQMANEWMEESEKGEK